MTNDIINKIHSEDLGDIEYCQSLHDKARNNLHMSSVLTLIKATNELISSIDIDYSFFHPKLDIYPRYNVVGEAEELYISISFNEDTNNLRAKEFLNQNKSIIKSNEDYINKITKTIFADLVKCNSEYLISVDIGKDFDNNCDKIIKALLSDSQLKEMTTLKLNKELVNKPLAKKTTKL